MRYSIRLEPKLTKQMSIKNKAVISPLESVTLSHFSLALTVPLALNLLFPLSRVSKHSILRKKATLSFWIYCEKLKTREDPTDLFCYDEPFFE